ncbi:hypothetical protein [Snodgrassella communis]|uniref:hypothetical protein n=1 Tax=Snodgrassella communis TaxID=2946699 RepID=UPI001EF7086F|nr:hypothetical protein [Snodgrassella communis]
MKAFVRQEIIAGLQLLCTLRLQGAPPSDGIEATAQGWLIALEPRTAGFDEQLDQGRITKAFQLLAAKTVRWPPPVALIELIPERPRPKQLGHDTKLTKEQKKQGQANLKVIKEMINQVLNKN